MRLLVAECTGPAVARWLGECSHDVVSVYDSARGMSDDDVIALAHSDSRILITNDRDFGEKIYRDRHPHCGVVYLRLKDERVATKIAVLEDLIRKYEARLKDAFVVVTEKHVRFGGR